jgi:glycine betaine/proline transport system permease protein
VLLVGAFLYVGTTGMPWIAFMVIVTACAARYGGWKVATFAVLGQLFILVGGQWDQAMISVYLCATALCLSVVLGMALGIWGAASDRVSMVLRQINDTLQTVPQFVFLIPVLMLFGVGDFTGLVAIMLYAIVPCIRYTEHGLRQVPASQIEAGISMGCTRAQMLWQVRLPSAVPEILLGINQTILFAMGMLVIASLVGTDGLGQQIYIGLGKNDPGMGIVAGLSLAIIGMLADRILRSAAESRRAALGMAL